MELMNAGVWAFAWAAASQSAAQLWDYVITGKPLLAPTAMLEMAVSAAAVLLDGQDGPYNIMLCNTTFASPLLLGPGHVHTALGPDGSISVSSMGGMPAMQGRFCQPSNVRLPETLQLVSKLGQALLLESALKKPRPAAYASVASTNGASEAGFLCQPATTAACLDLECGPGQTLGSVAAFTAGMQRDCTPVAVALRAASAAGLHSSAGPAAAFQHAAFKPLQQLPAHAATEPLELVYEVEWQAASLPANSQPPKHGGTGPSCPKPLGKASSQQLISVSCAGKRCIIGRAETSALHGIISASLNLLHMLQSHAEAPFRTLTLQSVGAMPVATGLVAPCLSCEGLAVAGIIKYGKLHSFLQMLYLLLTFEMTRKVLALRAALAASSIARWR